jgi:23S rRNA pseudouridine1911/1915/1917 synthase
MANRVRAHWSSSSPRKTYIARVAGRFSPGPGSTGEVRVEAKLGRRHGKDFKSAFVDPEGGKESATSFWLLREEVSDNGTVTSMVLCVLHSGRFHQIRAHLAHLGFPIVGDVRYSHIHTHSNCPVCIRIVCRRLALIAVCV